MKAIVYKKYGPPEVASVMEVAKPVALKNQVLVKVYATTINRTDSGFRSAEYFVSRFWSGLIYPKLQILGCEFSGEIEDIGEQVTEFKKGDKVFGYNDVNFGAHAEYLCINQDEAITKLPNNLNYIEAAALTEGSHYALNNIREAKVEKGQEVLVYGATGSIGSAAVQLLKYYGAVVTAVCNTKNCTLVKSLGADTVIDYQTQDFTNTQTKYNFIFDAVGKSSFGICKPLLTEKGVYISTELGKNGENIFYALFTPLFGKKRVLFPMPKITKEDVIFLKELAEKGIFKPVIDRQYNIKEAVEAYKYVETGQKTGNVIINVVEEN
jgi:NADPH:quinone reductase-like Zn-dependent oxidoreductase